MLADNSHQKLKESSDAGRNVPDEREFDKSGYGIRPSIKKSHREASEETKRPLDQGRVEHF